MKNHIMDYILDLKILTNNRKVDQMFLRNSLIALSLLAGTVFAQTDSMVMVPKSMLPKSVIAQVEMQNVAQTYGKFAGIGKEIGVGIREGLGALTDETNKFANTKVGKFTMIIIAFKVLGLQLIQFIFGFTLWIFGSIATVFIYRSAIRPRRILKEVTKEGIKNYEIYEPCSSIQDWTFYLITIYAGFCLLCCAIIFIH
jgi:hypothetical protein